MEKIKIGFDAGILWNIIDEKGEIKISELKTISKLDIKDIYLALGWLARENKIHLFEKDKELNVCLISWGGRLPARIACEFIFTGCSSK